MKRIKIGFLAALLASCAATAATMPGEEEAYGDLAGRVVEHIRLWPGNAPHETEADRGQYKKNPKRNMWMRNGVSQPELVIVAPAAENRRDTIVIAMPGGGYSTQNISSVLNNCRPILDSGRWLAVLNYRIPRRAGREIYDAPREDAARAIRHLRANAAKFGWSPEKIGAIGFSAGGHLAAVSATSSQDTLYERIDALDDVSPHLNFSVPVYPAYVASDGPKGRNKNGGDGATIQSEFKFDAKTPPMFMVHGDKDHYSPMGSVLLYSELHRRKIPAQLFIYANVSHGLGDTVNVRGWQDRVVDWIDSIGF